ncbi:hypothetical protein R3P38DRAFT_2845583 [Favolaschia claudopus]|uniref:Uncharacterized protein n=1 Tax=Favolaschia claudopus TaxID=2862362 RepID=A0AAW0DT56_9AGAR
MSLVDWTISKFSGLYERGETEDFTQLDSDMDGIFANGAEINLNDEKIDLPKFKEFVASRWSALGTTEVQYKAEELTEKPVEEGNPNAGSIVEGKINVLRKLKIRIRAAPAKTSTVISFRAKIQTDPQPRIVQLSQTTEDKAVPIVIPRPHPVLAQS